MIDCIFFHNFLTLEQQLQKTRIYHGAWVFVSIHRHVKKGREEERRMRTNKRRGVHAAEMEKKSARGAVIVEAEQRQHTDDAFFH